MIIISACFNNENSSHNAFTCNVELSKVGKYIRPPREKKM